MAKSVQYPHPQKDPRQSHFEADLVETITSCNSSLTRTIFTVSMSVMLTIWMGKGGGAKTSTGLQTPYLPGPGGYIHSTSIWIENTCTQDKKQEVSFQPLFNKQKKVYTLTPS